MAAGEISTPQEYIGHHLTHRLLDLRTFELDRIDRLRMVQYAV